MCIRDSCIGGKHSVKRQSYYGYWDYWLGNWQDHFKKMIRLRVFMHDLYYYCYCLQLIDSNQKTVVVRLIRASYIEIIFWRVIILQLSCHVLYGIGEEFAHMMEWTNAEFRGNSTHHFICIHIFSRGFSDEILTESIFRLCQRISKRWLTRPSKLHFTALQTVLIELYGAIRRVACYQSIFRHVSW